MQMRILPFCTQENRRFGVHGRYMKRKQAAMVLGIGGLKFNHLVNVTIVIFAVSTKIPDPSRASFAHGRFWKVLPEGVWRFAKVWGKWVCRPEHGRELSGKVRELVSKRCDEKVLMSWLPTRMAERKIWCRHLDVG